ncbi:hypothetical protein PS2_046798 [Malus domestica]
MDFSAYYLVFFSVLFMLQYNSYRVAAPYSNETIYPQPQVCHHLSTLDHQYHKRRFPFPDRKLLQSKPKVDVEVAQDWSGDYKSIFEALTTVSNLCRSTTAPIIIHVKAGIYKEYIKIKTTMLNITFIRDGIDKTVDTGNKMWRMVRSLLNRQPLRNYIAS